jgi:hypothetical protein
MPYIPLDQPNWNSEIDEPDGKGFDHRFPKIASEFVKFKSLTSLVALTRQDDPDWIATDSSPGWQGPPQEFVVESKWWPKEFCDRWGEIDSTSRTDMVCKRILRHLEMAAED